LNPCLADDMGLGKTLEVIACLLKEREEASDMPPTKS
jgi:SNF2 family DNA or RNA helicase